MPLTCPAEPELLRFALTQRLEPDDAVARHLTRCPTCQARVSDIRRVIRGIEASASSAVAGERDCLDEAALAMLAAGRDDSGEREVRLAHLAACGHCRQELAQLIDLLADSALATELRQLARRRTPWAARRTHLIGAGLIAATVLLVLGLPRRANEAGLHRDPTITATAAPEPIAPIGDVATATTLTWSAVAGADRYRVKLFDAEGGIRYEAQTIDTLTVLPDSIVLAVGRSYLWKVEARTEQDRWATSALMEFRLSRDRSP